MSKYNSILVFLLLFFVSNLIFADIWYVDATKPPGGEGTNWGNACNNIQEAIDKAICVWIICLKPSCEIWVKEGTY